MSNNTIFNIIRDLVFGSLNNQLITTYEGSEYNLKNTHYLLGQVLRQIELPKERILVSNSTLELWNKLGLDINDIYNCEWKKKIISNNDNVIVYEYNGASKTPKDIKGRTLMKGDYFEYRAVFHDEHIIPINVIINGLKELAIKKELTDDKIKELIDKIYICKLTKEEDRKISKKCNRPLELLECYQEVYKNCSITIQELEEKLGYNS